MNSRSSPRLEESPNRVSLGVSSQALPRQHSNECPTVQQ